MSEFDRSTKSLIAQLRGIVGRGHVLTQPGAIRRYETGYRAGGGPAAAAVRPGSMVELWRAFQACVTADHIVIAQAANTGLTAGSTPMGRYDRPVVILNTLRIRGIFPVDGGEQVICLAGATLHDLERRLAPLGREPHSVIGSSCIGASVVGGVCNNSGGALVARGPAFTHYALYAQVDEAGEVQLRNHLGLRLSEDPEAALNALEHGRFTPDDLFCDGRPASAAEDYAAIVRAVDEPGAARFNADPKRLFEASGCAGKVLVFAVRLDTFPSPKRSAVFYIGTNDPAELTGLRCRMLANPDMLPTSGEYIHRDAFDIAERYGKDMVIAIRLLGTARLPHLFRLKNWLDRLAGAFRFLPNRLSDRVLQWSSMLFPRHLPARLRSFRDAYEHHLILKVDDHGIDFARQMLAKSFPSQCGDAFECDAVEARQAMLHRFAVAASAIRYQAIHPDTVEALVAIDVALRRNDRDWFEQLPREVENALVARLYYGHFFCHVFHQDYLVRKGADPVAVERLILAGLERRGAEYPAEHNVGHLYHAKPALADHYRRLDPTNQMNPGIGGTSRNQGYG